MSLSELQRRNKIVKFCLKNPNKSKSETVAHFKKTTWIQDPQSPLFTIQLKGLRNKKKRRELIV
jgi:hypothetical protein